MFRYLIIAVSLLCIVTASQLDASSYRAAVVEFAPNNKCHNDDSKEEATALRTSNIQAFE